MRGLKAPSKPPGKRRAEFQAQVRPLIPASLSGSGTSGKLAQWTGAAAIGDSLLYLDGNQRLVLPKGLVFPDTTMQDTAGGGGGGGGGNPGGGIAALDSSVLLEWKLTEAAAPFGNTGTGGSGATLSATGTPAPGAPTPVGKGVKFVAVAADNLQGANTVEPNGALWAAEAWLYLQAQQGPYYGHILGKAYRNDTTWTTPFSAFNFAVNNSNDGRIYYSFTIGGTVHTGTTSAPYPLLYGKLNHVAASYDGTTFRVYVNGELAGSLAVSGTIDWGTHGNWFVGQNTGHSASEALMGTVHGVRIHSGTVRTASYWLSQWQAVMGWST